MLFLILRQAQDVHYLSQDRLLSILDKTKRTLYYPPINRRPSRACLNTYDLN